MSKAPERIMNVSKTQFSLAMYFGAAHINGCNYHYDSETDSLIRHDAWDKMMAEDKDARKKWEDSEREKWAKIQQQLDGF